MEDLEKIKDAIRCIESVVFAAEFDGLLSGADKVCHFVKNAEEKELINKLTDAARTPLFEHEPDGLFPCMYRMNKLVEITKDFERVNEKMLPHLAMARLEFLENKESDISSPIMDELGKIKLKLKKAKEELETFIHTLEQTTPEPEKDNSKMRITPWLEKVFGGREAAQVYLDAVKRQLEHAPTQAPAATIGEFVRCAPRYYKHESNKRLAVEIQLCTGVKLTRYNFTHYKEGLKKFPKADK